MRLPKRVPWSNPAEIEQLCSWIYADEEDLPSKVFAVNRLSAWKASTALPHALESILSLLTVILQDEHTSTLNIQTPTLLLRQSYALALIRLVNGLVDPLQQGAFARSIGAIAMQIGLPLWLVELRHASTHEELPSLELLREGTREAMSWLLQNYFLPTLSPANRRSPPALSDLSPLIAQYKGLLKRITRDASLKSRSKPELVRILHQVDDWVVEAKVAASMISLETKYEQENERERWALEQLCGFLMDRGGIVPISKRKRSSLSQDLTVPILQHVSLWSPLILHVHSRYPIFPSVLLSRILSRILSPLERSEPVSLRTNVSEGLYVDPTYDQTLASWALWIMQRWGDDPDAECDRANVLKELLVGLGRGDCRAGRALITALAEQEQHLGESVALLTNTIRSSGRVSRWEDDSLDIMSSRLCSLVQKNPNLPTIGNNDVVVPPPLSDDAKSQPIKGWRLLAEGDSWKPCPIGVFSRPQG